MNNDRHSSQFTQISLVSHPSLSAQDDVLLINASQHRNQEAFALLVRKYQRPIFTLALHILQNDEEADSITQEMFLAAWKALPSFPKDAPFSLWLSRLTYQRCMQQRKQQTPEKRGHATLHAVPRRERQHQQTMVAGGDLSKLPTIARVVLILRYLQELTYEEMALVLTLPVHTIKDHLFGARNLLKEQGQARQQGED